MASFRNRSPSSMRRTSLPWPRLHPAQTSRAVSAIASTTTPQTSPPIHRAWASTSSWSIQATSTQRESGIVLA